MRGQDEEQEDEKQEQEVTLSWRKISSYWVRLIVLTHIIPKRIGERARPHILTYRDATREFLKSQKIASSVTVSLGFHHNELKETASGRKSA